MSDTDQSPTSDSPFKVAVVRNSDDELAVIMQLNLPNEAPQYFEFKHSEAWQLGSDLLGASGAAILGEHMWPTLTDEQRLQMFGDTWSS